MHQDATKRPIVKGDYVTYAVSAGSSTGMKFGVVVKLKEKVVQKRRYNPSTKTFDYSDSMDYSIQVVSVERTFVRTPNQNDPYAGDYAWQVQGKTEGKLARIQSIERLDRVVVLGAQQMHPEAKDALDKELHERGQL